MNYRPTIEYAINPMTESIQALPAIELHEFALSMLYRLSAYAVINLIDDAAMLSIVFI
jgi:hypothetical protein